MPASTAPSVRLGELTAAQAAEAFVARPVLLLPLGSHESHGPSLPMGDYLAAELIAVRIARAAASLGQGCLVAPVLPFGGADFFGSVPGGIALSPATLRAVLSDMVEGLLRHGLDRLIIINGHGGNAAAIHEVTLGIRRSTGTVIPSFYLWKVARQLLDEIVGSEVAAIRAGHGADPVASICMHLFDLPPASEPAAPAGTLMGLKVNNFGSVEFESIAVEMPLELREIAPSGVAPGADPRLANASDGAALTARLVEIGASFVTHYGRHR